MAMMPKRVLHRKQQRGKIKGNATRGNTVEFGEVGLQSMEGGWLSARQIEAGRVAISRSVPGAKVYIRIFPHKPITGIPLETRMGKGKGEPEYYAAVIKPGTVLFEIGGVPEAEAHLALNRAVHKMPIRCRLVRRRHV
ncbi:MAG: 50S ribosomal protein L16 [Planctomycetes bacterium]|nr:50S ribosomal protein L16 [Planctomycetota bacterium]